MITLSMTIDWTSSTTLGIEIAIAIAISTAAYYFINWPTAAILLIVLSSTALIIWNSLQYITIKKDNVKVKEGPTIWLTKFRIAVSTLSILALLLIASLYLSITNFGYTTIKSYIIHSSIIAGFSCIAYFVYRFFYPDMFWPRYSIANKQWKSVVDCRNYSEYEGGHYKNAIHWPIDTLNHQNIYDRLKEIKSPVLVYDNTGKLSKEWKDKFDLITEEMGIKGIQIAYTDAHWK